MLRFRKNDLAKSKQKCEILKEKDASIIRTIFLNK